MGAEAPLFSVSVCRSDRVGWYRIRARWNAKDVSGPLVHYLLAHTRTLVGKSEFGVFRLVSAEGEWEYSDEIEAGPR